MYATTSFCFDSKKSSFWRWSGLNGASVIHKNGVLTHNADFIPRDFYITSLAKRSPSAKNNYAGNLPCFDVKFHIVNASEP